MIFVIFCAFISILVIIGNLVVIVVFLKSKEMRITRSAMFKISISVSDLLNGCSAPFIIFNSPKADQMRLFSIAWYLYFGFWILTTSVSICTLTAMGLDRLYAVMYPLKMHVSHSRKYILFTVSGIWIFSVILAMLPTYLLITDKMGEVVTATGMVLVAEQAKEEYITFFVVGLSMTWFTSISLYISIKRKNRVVFAMSADSQHVARAEKENAIAAMLIVMVVAFTTSVLPISIYVALPKPNPIICALEYTDTVIDLVEIYPNWLRKMEASVWLIYMTNGLWNCIIYSFHDVSFRKSAKKIFCPSRSRQSTLNPNQ